MKGKVLIIAEAGVNHNGDFELAKQLIDVAAVAGADYVKFQTFKADKLVTQSAKKAAYQVINTQNNDSQYDMLKKLEMPEEWHYQLKDYSSKRGIKFLSSGFDEESIDFLDSLGIQMFKIPSGEITNRPYLEHVAKKGKPIILSTGMADLEEIKEAITIFTDSGIQLDMITVLHCNTEYPTPMEDVNLLAMNTINRELGVKVGYSDHTHGIDVPIAAVALGAVVIEKHFTLDRNMPGPDHSASLEPKELIAMIEAIRNVELCILGSGKKYPSPSELKNKAIARRSIHLKTDMSSGQVITTDHLEMKRPGDGISPMLINSILGRRVKVDLPTQHKLNLNDLE
jgi:N-acetylneuraminate synthase/N,N'-diacetyllegionaminate synthase